MSTGARLSENTTNPVTRRPSPAVLPTRVNNPRPTTASVKLATMTTAGRNRRASTGVSRDPATNPAEDGSIHRPAASGDRPSTSCRYWEMNSRVPNPTKKLSRLVVSAVVKTADEQPKIQQRVGQPTLPAHERRPGRESGHHRHRGQPPEAVAGDSLEPVDDCQHHRHRQGRADQI